MPARAGGRTRSLACRRRGTLRTVRLRAGGGTSYVRVLRLSVAPVTLRCRGDRRKIVTVVHARVQSRHSYYLNSGNRSSDCHGDPAAGISAAIQKELPPALDAELDGAGGV